MSILTMYAASKLPHSPSKPYLSKQSHKDPPPGYFVEDDGSLKIDTNNEEWKLIISTRKIQAEIGVDNGLKTSDHKIKKPVTRKPPGTKPKTPVNKKSNIPPKKNKPPEVKPIPPIPEDPELVELRLNSVKAVYKDKILNVEKKQNDVTKQRIAINKEAKNLIQYEMAEYLFFGYMEKLNYELLRLPKKLKPITVNLLKTGKHEEVVKRFSKEVEKIIVEIKRSQAKELKDWQNDK